MVYVAISSLFCSMPSKLVNEAEGGYAYAVIGSRKYRAGQVLRMTLR